MFQPRPAKVPDIAQIALVPVWFGICMIFGFPETAGKSEIQNRALSFFVKVLTLIVASLAVYVLSGTANGALEKIKAK